MQEPTLVGHAELLEWGYSFRDRERAVGRGNLTPIRAGLYAIAEEWDSASPEQRIVARARALTVASKSPPVFSHETAAAIHGLPLYSSHPTHVHAIVPSARAGAAAGVIRHRGDLALADVVTLDGLLCTRLERTVADMARTAAFEQSVTVTDAALRRLFVTDAHHYDADGARAFRDEVLDIVRLSAHGQSRAERAVRFADGRAQLPGESVSRIRLAELGFRAPRLQVAVPGPAGDYFVDFALDDVDALGEFDGRIKYRDGRLLVDRSADEVFEAEKQREDWIRGVTQRRFARWGWPHIATAATLGARLSAFGIRPPA